MQLACGRRQVRGARRNHRPAVGSGGHHDTVGVVVARVGADSEAVAGVGDTGDPGGGAHRQVEMLGIAFRVVGHLGRGGAVPGADS